MSVFDARRLGARLTIVLALAAPGLAAGAAAQDERPSIAGRVVDSEGTPLEGADVEVFGARRRVTTPASGRFEFAELDGARYWVHARRVGYLPFQASVSLKKGEHRQLVITLERAPVELEEVEVTAKADASHRRMREFMWRSRATWGGRFLTRDDLVRFEPARLGDIVIRHLPRKALFTMDQPSSGGRAFFPTQAYFNASRLAGRTRYYPECPPALAVNGGSVLTGFAVNDFSVDEVEAVEVYREGAHLPIEYSWGDQARCGLVVIWLRSRPGGDES